MSQKQKILTIIITVAILVALTVGIVYFVIGIVNSIKDITYSPNIEESPIVNTQYAVALSQTSTSFTEDGKMQLTLKATVTPADAYNTAVNWSVSWGEGASRASEAADEYVKVTPLINDSLIAVVECIKPYDGDSIIVTVTTVDGGYTAQCVCDFVSVNSDLELIFDERYYNSTDNAYRIVPGTYKLQLDRFLPDNSNYDLESNGYTWSISVNAYNKEGYIPILGYTSFDRSEEIGSGNKNIKDFEVFDFAIDGYTADFTVGDLWNDVYIKAENGDYIFIDMQALLDDFQSNLVLTLTVTDNMHPEMSFSFDFVIIPKFYFDLSDFDSKYTNLECGINYDIPIIFEDKSGRKFDFSYDSINMLWINLMGSGDTVPILNENIEIDTNSLFGNVLGVGFVYKGEQLFMRITVFKTLENAEFYVPELDKYVKLDVEKIRQYEHIYGQSPFIINVYEASTGYFTGFYFDIIS